MAMRILDDLGFILLNMERPKERCEKVDRQEQELEPKPSPTKLPDINCVKDKCSDASPENPKQRTAQKGCERSQVILVE